ncbi:MAG: hypothetical protein ABSE22_23865, partial [Xanthobacteraceae bacterium]
KPQLKTHGQTHGIAPGLHWIISDVGGWILRAAHEKMLFHQGLAGLQRKPTDLGTAATPSATTEIFETLEMMFLSTFALRARFRPMAMSQF